MDEEVPVCADICGEQERLGASFHAPIRKTRDKWNLSEDMQSQVPSRLGFCETYPNGMSLSTEESVPKSSI